VNSKTLKDLGEAAIIQLIQEKGASSLPLYIKKGIGDDAAVLETRGDRVLLVTTDTLIEGIHFTGQTVSSEALGWKALAANVSDIAAMGGIPRTAFLSMGMTADTAVSFVESFMAGFQALAGQANIALAGGDIIETKSGKVITITLLGECLAEHVVYRSGAQVGDDVWVTGPLGNAAAGLFLLHNGDSPASPGYESLVVAHQRPMPRYEMGKALGESRLAHAMIDVSDGIAKDLGHICEESGTGALLQVASVPLSDKLKELAAEFEKSPLEWALHGGEDYELLFTASPTSREKIVSLTKTVLGIPPLKIGTIIEGDTIWLETEQGKQPLSSGGYVHFA
jgi:thiamine-monophosphate kinase